MVVLDIRWVWPNVAALVILMIFDMAKVGVFWIVVIDVEALSTVKIVVWLLLTVKTACGATMCCLAIGFKDGVKTADIGGDFVIARITFDDRGGMTISSIVFT